MASPARTAIFPTTPFASAATKGSLMAPSKQHLPRAFTIIEILVVVTIIAVLMGILLPSFFRIQKNAKKATTSSTLSAIQSGLTQYYNDFGSFPPSAPAMTGIPVNHG